MDSTLGENIARFRREKEMSQEELALHLHVTRQAVSNWERNRSMPDIVTLRNMSLLFGVTMEDIVSGGRALPELPPPDRRLALGLYLLTMSVGAVEIVWQLSAGKGADLVIPVAIVLLITTLLHFLLDGMLKTGKYSLLAGFDDRRSDPLKLRRMVASMERFITAEGFCFCLICFPLALFAPPAFAFSVLMGLYIAAFVGGLLSVIYQYSRVTAANPLEASASRVNALLLICFLGALGLSVGVLLLSMSLFQSSGDTASTVLHLLWFLPCAILAVVWLLRELMLVRRSVERSKTYRPSRFSWVALGLILAALAGMLITGALF